MGWDPYKEGDALPVNAVVLGLSENGRRLYSSLPCYVSLDFGVLVPMPRRTVGHFFLWDQSLQSKLTLYLTQDEDTVMNIVYGLC